MAPRRFVRSVKVINNNNNYNNLSLNDVLCPICRCIFIEPVTLPCSHGFCLPCFEGTLANANLTCPLCRIRFGSWHRIAKKERKIINSQFWDAIKLTFPIEVKNRMNGIEEHLQEPVQIRLTNSKVLRKGYEVEQVQEEPQQQQQLVKQVEIKARNDYIKNLSADNEERIECVKDHVAKQLVKEISMNIDQAKENNSSKGLDFLPQLDKKQCMFVYKIQNNNRNLTATSSTVDKQTIINSLLKVNQKTSDVMVNVCDKRVNCIIDNLKQFKPIEQINVPLKQIISPIRVPAKPNNKIPTVIIRPPNGKIFFVHNRYVSAFASFVEAPTMAKPPRKRQLLLANNNNEAKSTAKRGERSGFFLPTKRPSIHQDDDNGQEATFKRKPPTSPPFRGFDNANKSDNARGTKKLNNVHHLKIVDDDVPSTASSTRSRRSSRDLQEESDLAFARRLHEQLNGSRYYTRSNVVQPSSHKRRPRNDLIERRQRNRLTLDRFVNSPEPAVT